VKLHFYAQYSHHEDAFVVADAEGLRALRDACDVALRRGATAFQTFAEDGEGYLAFLVNLETRDPKWEQLDLPYQERFGARPKLGPVDVIGPRQYREISTRTLTE
jgi:hypothetical protein